MGLILYQILSDLVLILMNSGLSGQCVDICDCEGRTGEEVKADLFYTAVFNAFGGIWILLFSVQAGKKQLCDSK